MIKVLLPTLGTPTTMARTVLRTPFSAARSTVSRAARSISAMASFTFPGGGYVGHGVQALLAEQAQPGLRRVGIGQVGLIQKQHARLSG